MGGLIEYYYDTKRLTYNKSERIFKSFPLSQANEIQSLQCLGRKHLIIQQQVATFMWKSSEQIEYI